MPNPGIITLLTATATNYKSIWTSP